MAAIKSGAAICTKGRKAMKQRDYRPRLFTNLFQGVIAVFSVTALSLDQSVVLAQAQPAQSQELTTTTPATKAAPPIPADQLDSLVAPIALYPDPLLAQTLAASTYPLEVIQLQQWMDRNKNLKDKALADAVEKQNWDPSVQAMAAFPDVVTRLAGNIQWTTDLGNAFLAQQSDVMDSVQRMRAKAQGTGNLKTSAQQKVETQTVEGKQVIVVQQANPQVIYVPSYDPVVVYGPPIYPYYPYYYPGYIAGRGLWFGAGLALGAAWGGGWGWGCGWGHSGNVTINYNNKYVNNSNKNWNGNNNWNKNNNRPSRLPANGGNWQHNPQHRGNAPYGDRNTSNKYGQGNRPGGGTGAGAGNRPGGGASTLPANRPGGGTGNAGAGNRPGSGAGASTRPSGGAGGGAGARPGGEGAGARPATRPSGGGGGGDRIGGRSVSSGSSGSAFGGSGSSGSSARNSSSRGGHSMGGGGFSGGGGRRR
jgi:hypothetical protein